MKAITRKEQFLSAIAGEIEAPEPRTREEVYMKKISENGSGGEPEVVIIDRSGGTEHIGNVKRKMTDSLDNNIPTIFYLKQTKGIYLVSSIIRDEGLVRFSVVAYDATMPNQAVRTSLYKITDSNTIEPVIE